MFSQREYQDPCDNQWKSLSLGSRVTEVISKQTENPLHRFSLHPHRWSHVDLFCNVVERTLNDLAVLITYLLTPLQHRPGVLNISKINLKSLMIIPLFSNGRLKPSETLLHDMQLYFLARHVHLLESQAKMR